MKNRRKSYIIAFGSNAKKKWEQKEKCFMLCKTTHRKEKKGKK